MEYARKKYWNDFSEKGKDFFTMMLDKSECTEQLNKEDVAEILSFIPDLKGKDIIELGAGSGRITPHLAKNAKSVRASDFMEVFVEENKRLHESMGNISFEVADVAFLDYPAESADVVFINWLFAYLSDEEISSLLCRILRWLRPGGHFYFRESCFRKSGCSKLAVDLSKYRVPSVYTKFLLTARNDAYRFEMLHRKPSYTYLKYKNNPFSVMWLSCKVNTPVEVHDDSLDPHALLDSMYGFGYITPVNSSFLEDVLKKIEIPKHPKVLDIGMGAGGNLYHFAKNYDAYMQGCDISPQCVDWMVERAWKDNLTKSQLEVADASRIIVPDCSFDVVLCVNMLHEFPENKRSNLMKNTYHWLGKNGFLIFTELLSPEDTSAKTFDPSSNLLTQSFCEKILKDVGFNILSVTDFTEKVKLRTEEAVTKLGFVAESDSCDKNFALRHKQQCAALLEGIKEGIMMKTIVARRE